MGLFSYEELMPYIDGNNKEKRMKSDLQITAREYEYNIIKCTEGYKVKIYSLIHNYYIKGHLWWRSIEMGDEEWEEYWMKHFKDYPEICQRFLIEQVFNTEKEARVEAERRFPTARERDKVI